LCVSSQGVCTGRRSSDAKVRKVSAHVSETIRVVQYNNSFMMSFLPGALPSSLSAYGAFPKTSYLMMTSAGRFGD
jgi:hypothetical protein